MRFMIIVKASKQSEAGILPREQLLADMGKFNEELTKAGVMLAGEGLQASSKGARVKFAGDKRIVTDGPFTETKELVAGFWIWKCNSKQEAVDWVKRCPNPMPGEEAEIEIRQVFEMEDFGGQPVPELHACGGAATTFTTPTDRELVMTRAVDAPRSRVFDAWTNPKHLPKWMLGPAGWSMPVCEIDLRPGGKWHFVWRKSDGAEMSMTGEYREIKLPEKLVSTESWGAPWPETLNTLGLTESNGKTTIEQTILYPNKDARDAALKTGMKDGVAASFNRLAEYLRTNA